MQTRLFARLTSPLRIATAACALSAWAALPGQAQTYNVIVNDFLATGGEGYNAGGRATAARPLKVVDLDALIDYIKSLPSPITAPTEVRIAPISP